MVRERVAGKGVEKLSPATPALKYWKKIDAGEILVALPGCLHPTASSNGLSLPPPQKAASPCLW